MHAAPGLQRVLNAALEEGGWFGEAHERQVMGAATTRTPPSAWPRCARCWPRRPGSGCWSGWRSASSWRASSRHNDDERTDHMDIRYLGHATFELSDGDTRVLIDPFLAPNNPKAPVTADEVEPTHIVVTHGHVDHLADAVPLAQRTGAPVVAIVELAGELARGPAGGSPGPRPQPRRHHRVRLGLGEVRARLAHLDDAEGHREHAGGRGDQPRRHDRLPHGRHRAVQRSGARRPAHADRRRDRLHRRPLHDGPPRRGRGGEADRAPRP